MSNDENSEIIFSEIVQDIYNNIENENYNYIVNNYGNDNKEEIKEACMMYTVINDDVDFNELCNVLSLNTDEQENEVITRANLIYHAQVSVGMNDYSNEYHDYTPPTSPDRNVLQQNDIEPNLVLSDTSAFMSQQSSPIRRVTNTNQSSIIGFDGLNPLPQFDVPRVINIPQNMNNIPNTIVQYCDNIVNYSELMKNILKEYSDINKDLFQTVDGFKVYLIVKDIMHSNDLIKDYASDMKTFVNDINQMVEYVYVCDNETKTISNIIDTLSKLINDNSKHINDMKQICNSISNEINNMRTQLHV